LESCKHVTVGTKFSQPLLSSSFRRTPRGGIEMDQFVKMVDDVKEVILSTSEDHWVWDLENTGEFSVSSIRNLIDEKTLPLTDYKARWNKLVPIKVQSVEGKNNHRYRSKVEVIAAKLDEIEQVMEKAKDESETREPKGE
ncbi:hypothetical protein Tco_1088767, partial [Tanacetum coccineum]